jgi:serine/threonine protein kinase
VPCNATVRSYSSSARRLDLDFGSIEDDQRKNRDSIKASGPRSMNIDKGSSSSLSIRPTQIGPVNHQLIRSHISSMSFSGASSMSATNSMYWDPVFDDPNDDPFRIGSYGKMTSMLEQKADILVNGGTNSGRASPIRTGTPTLPISGTGKTTNIKESTSTATATASRGATPAIAATKIPNASISTRPPRPNNERQQRHHHHHHHPQVAIPSVESITIDFSAVRVYKHKQLDIGSTATVYEGKYMNERVAVKLCHLRTLNQKSVADFVRESRTLAAFNHTNVMGIVGCCPVPPNFMIVSEYCSRGNLAKVLHGKDQKTILTWHMRLFLALGAARGINHVHSKGFMHGDIKPDNFIVTEDWIVKVSDFGEASQTKQTTLSLPLKRSSSSSSIADMGNQDDNNRTSTNIDIDGSGVGSSGGAIVGGTIFWLAPERLAPIYKLFLDDSTRTRDEWNLVGSGLTKAADVYSFSLTVWEILTGRHLFEDKDSFEVGLLVLTESLRPDLNELDNVLKKAPPAMLSSSNRRDTLINNKDILSLKSLLRAGWAPHPSLRPNMRQMQHDLNKAYDKEHAAATKRSEKIALRSFSSSTGGSFKHSFSGTGRYS